MKRFIEAKNPCAVFVLPEVAHRHVKVPVYVLTLLALACGNAKTTMAPATRYTGPPINAISVDKESGVLRDWVILELEARGFVVPENADSAQAVMRITGTGDQEGLPRSAAIRLVSVPDRTVITSGTWSNGWGFQSGSLLDHVVRVDAATAARQIVDSVCKVIAPERIKPPKKSLRDR